MQKEYEIYAVKYAGPIESSGAFIMWNKDWDKKVVRNYYIWCIKGDDHTIIVDAGVSPLMANRLKLPNYVNPADLLARIDIDNNDIENVIISHLHFDHSNGVSLFPKATFYIQQKEFDFWTGSQMARRPPFRFYLDEESNAYLKKLEGTERLQLIKGDQELFPGIKVLLTSGHSYANQSIAVNTKHGTAIIGSDCGHFFRNYQEDWPSVLIVDLVEWMKSFNKVRSQVSSLDLLFPGHDPLMTEKYPQVVEGITRLV